MDEKTEDFLADVIFWAWLLIFLVIMPLYIRQVIQNTLLLVIWLLGVCLIILCFERVIKKVREDIRKVMSFIETEYDRKFIPEAPIIDNRNCKNDRKKNYVKKDTPIMTQNENDPRAYFTGKKSNDKKLDNYTKLVIGFGVVAVILLIIGYLRKYFGWNDEYNNIIYDFEYVFFAIEICFAGMAIYIIYLEKTTYKNDAYFCPHCDRLIYWADPWECPYCYFENSLAVNKYNTIFSPCGRCGRQANLLKCHYLDCGKLIELNNLNDGKIIILGSSKEKRDTKSEMMNELKKVFESIVNLNREDQKNPVMILRQLGILTAGQISLEEALNSGNPQQISQTIDELVKRLSATLSSDDLSHKLESLRKSEQFKFEKERIHREYDRKRTVRDAFDDLKTREEIYKEFEYQKEKILKGRRLSELSQTELNELEDLEDRKDQVLRDLP